MEEGLSLGIEGPVYYNAFPLKFIVTSVAEVRLMPVTYRASYW